MAFEDFFIGEDRLEFFISTFPFHRPSVPLGKDPSTPEEEGGILIHRRGPYKGLGDCRGIDRVGLPSYGIPSFNKACMGNLVVDAYSGYKGEETPRAFTHDGVRRIVDQIVGRWYTEGHSYYRVRADDGYRYVLRCDLDNLMWELVMREEEK